MMIHCRAEVEHLVVDYYPAAVNQMALMGQKNREGPARHPMETR